MTGSIKRYFLWKYILFFCVAVLASLAVPLLGLIFLCVTVTTRIAGRVSFVEKLCFVVLSAIIANALLYEIFNLARLHPNIRIIGLCYLVLGLVTLLRFPSRKSSAFISRRVVISLIGAVIVFGGLMYPVTLSKTARISHPDATLHLLTAGEDNASHYALFRYAYLHDGYAYTSSQNNNSGIIGGLENYPQGSEFSISWLTKAVLGSHYTMDNAILIEAYYAFCALVYATVAFLVLLLALAFFELRGGRIRLIHATVGITLVFAFIAIGPLLYLLGRGFLSQVFSYIYLLALIYAVSPIADFISIRLRLLFIALMFSGICIAWWFLSPVAALAIIAFVVQKWGSVKDLVKLKYGIALVVLALLSIYPIVLTVITGATNKGSLTQSGGVDTLARTTIVFYLLGCFSILYNRKKDTLRSYFPLGLTIVGWLLFTIALGLYQELTAHQVSYYYYKSIYTLIPLSGVLIVYGSLLITNRLSLNTKRLQQVGSSVFVLILFVTILAALKPVYPRVYFNDWFNNPIIPNDLAVMFSTPQNTYSDLIYVGGCSQPSTYILNRWTGALFQSEVGSWHRNVELDTLYSAQLSSSQAKLQKLLENPPLDGTKTYVYVESSCAYSQSTANVTKLIQQVGYASNVQEIN